MVGLAFELDDGVLLLGADLAADLLNKGAGVEAADLHADGPFAAALVDEVQEYSHVSL